MKKAIFFWIGIFFMMICLIPNKASYAQAHKKECEPPQIIFKNFQRKSMNLFVGAGMISTRVEKSSNRGFHGLVGLNYFPLNYFEIGLKLKPKTVKYPVSGRNTLLENSLYTRYYPFSIPCRKLAVFGGASVYRDGSAYNIKGQAINRNTLFPAIDGGMILLIGKQFQLDVNSSYFFNRPLRSNLSFAWNIKNFRKNHP